MLGRFILALLLTLAIEGGVAWLLGLRTCQFLLAVTMINMITNPILNLLLLVLAYLGMEVTLLPVVLLEVLVVLAEWQLLVYVFGDPKGRFFVLSLLVNAASFLAGILFFWI